MKDVERKLKLDQYQLRMGELDATDSQSKRGFNNLFDPIILNEVAKVKFDARAVKCDACAGMAYIGHWEAYVDFALNPPDDTLTIVCMGCVGGACQIYIDSHHLPYHDKYAQLRYPSQI